MLVKDSARLSLRGVHGVATGVDFKWLALPQAGVGAELRLIRKDKRSFVSKCPRDPGKRFAASLLQGGKEDSPSPGSPDASFPVCSSLLPKRTLGFLVWGSRLKVPKLHVIPLSQPQRAGITAPLQVRKVRLRG